MASREPVEDDWCLDRGYSHPFVAHIATKTCGFVPVQGASERNNHLFQVREIRNSRQGCVIWGDIAWLCGVSYYTKIGVHITDSGARANCAGDHPIGLVCMQSLLLVSSRPCRCSAVPSAGVSKECV